MGQVDESVTYREGHDPDVPTYSTGCFVCVCCFFKVMKEYTYNSAVDWLIFLYLFRPPPSPNVGGRDFI